MSPPQHDSGGPALIGKRGLVLALAMVGLAALALSVRTARRAEEAAQAPVSGLSLTLLRQAVRERPEDGELAFKLAQALSEVGQEPEALELLATLVTRDDDIGQDARTLAGRRLVTRVFAVPAAQVETREQARDRVLPKLEALAEGATSETLVELAEIAEQIDASRLRAALLERAVRGKLKVDARGVELMQEVERADAAFLALGSPEGAGILLADVAAQLGPQQGEALALLALDRFMQAPNPEVAYGRYERKLGEVAAVNLRVQHKALQLASAVSAERAYLHSVTMLAHPQAGEAERRAHLQWALWSDHREAALDALTTLCAEGCGYQDRRVLRELRGESRPRLKATSDALEHRLARAPFHRPTLLSLLATLEAQGDFEAAIRVIHRARSAAPRDVALLRLELGLRLRLGDEEHAQKLLEVLRRNRLASRIELEQLADFLISRGRLIEGLAVLREGALQSGDAARLRQLVEYALEIDALDTARIAARKLLAQRKAAPDDLRILAALEVEAGRPQAAGDALMIAYERYGEADLLEESLAHYAASGDGGLLLRAVARSEQYGDLTTQRLAAGRTKARAQAHHMLAKRAVDAADYKGAQRQLSLAKAALDRPADEVGPIARDLAELQRANRRLALSLALNAKDTGTVAEVFPSLESELTVPERVHVLRELGRDAEAHGLSLSTLRSNPPADRASREQLDAHLQILHPVRQHTVGARGYALSLPGLRTFGVGADVAVGAGGVLFEVQGDYQDLYARSDARGIFPADRVLRGALTASFLELPLQPHLVAGVDGRDVLTTLPIVGAGLVATDDRALRATFDLLLNEPATDTAPLRVLGSKDSADARAVLSLSRNLYSQVNARLDAFRARRGRTLLGWGATLEAGVGAHGEVGAIAARWNARLLGRFAPRYSLAADTLGLTPDGSTFFGVGAGLARGQLEGPQLWGRRLSFVLDGSVGYLVPQRVVGFSGRAGVGLPVFTGDQVAVTVQADNTVGANAGQTAIAATVNYAFSLDR